MNWSSLSSFWDWLNSTWESILPKSAIQFPPEPEDNQVFGRFIWAPNYPSFEEYGIEVGESYLFSDFNDDYPESTFTEFSRSLLSALPASARGTWDFN
jgi:hypothetical protein